MSTISGLGSAGGAWSGVGSTGGTPRRERMFAKVDTDGSGGVDKTELQSMLDHISEKSGTSLGKAEDLFSSMDTDGNGSLSSDELDTGMKSLMPPPSSTMEFAQRSHGAQGGERPSGPPPCDDSQSDDQGLQALFKSIDTNGDSKLSADETQAFAQKMASLFAQFSNPQTSDAALSLSA